MEILFTRPAGKTVFRVFGTSWAGRLTKRDGETVQCGHNHKNRGTAAGCLKRMRRERPGKCQDYRIEELILAKREKASTTKQDKAK